MDIDTTKFATTVTNIDWLEFRKQRRELIQRYSFSPSKDLEGLISFLEKFQKEAAALLGKDVVWPGYELDDIFEEDNIFCQKMLQERGYIYCPYCLNDELDTFGYEDSRKHTYQVLICRHCEKTFAIRYDNPMIVSEDEMSEDLVKRDNLDLSKVEGL